MKKLKIKRQDFIVEQLDELAVEFNKRGISASIDEIHCLCDLSHWSWPDDIDKAVDELLNYAKVI